MSKKGFLEAFATVVIGLILYGALTYIFYILGFGENAGYWGVIGFFIFPAFLRYKRLGFKKVNEDIQEAEKGIGNILQGIFYLCIGLVILIGIFWVCGKVINEVKYRLTPKDWRLDVYSSPEPDRDQLKIEIPGYKTQTECTEKGYSYTKSSGSFECSYGCGKTKEYSGMEDVCDKVCNKFGCRN